MIKCHQFTILKVNIEQMHKTSYVSMVVAQTHLQESLHCRNKGVTSKANLLEMNTS